MASRENMGTAIEIGLVERVAGALRYVFTGKEPVWFGPQNPLPPVAPANERESVAGRQFDYPVGFNQRTQPRGDEVVSFAQMRALADGYDIMRLVIETRKDQLAKLRWHVRPKDEKKTADDRCKAITDFLAMPDREHTWDEWLRMLLEDLFVIDAPTLYARPTKGGQLYALEPVDGTTIKRVIDEHGRTPEAPLPAYQQILKGVPAIDYTRDELIYKPRNLRTHKLYGYGPVEQVIMTVNIAIRRQLNQLSYYTEGNIPNTIFRVPKEWNPDQIKQFQRWWDELTSGQSKHVGRFIPEGPDPIDTKQQALKDEYDEWLARVICFAFSISPTPFVKQMNRATADNATEQALTEGLAPIMNWVKNLIDYVVVKYFGAADLEFSWQEEDATSPLEQAQIAQIYLSGKVLTPDEVRQDLGRDPLTPEEREAAFPLPPAPVPPGGAGDEEDGPVPPQKKAPATAKEAVAKAKKAARSIDRERDEITKLRAKLERTVKAFLKDRAVDVAAQVVAAREHVGKSEADDIRRILDALNLGDWVTLVGDVDPILEEIAKSGVLEALAQIGMADDESIVALANEQAVEWAKDRAAEWVGMRRDADGNLTPNPNAEWQIDESTREMLNAKVAQALEEGWSNDQLAEEIEADHAFSPERAEMIARTETAFADVAGNMDAYRASGVVAEKKWITGAECCDDCQELDGMVVALDEDFPNGGGDGPPLHPNCRCDVVPIVADDEQPNDGD